MKGDVTWSARRKSRLVLRLLRGEDARLVSREVRVSERELEAWKETFLRGGEEALKQHPRRPQERKLEEARKKIELLTMQVELYRLRVATRRRVDQVRALVGQKSPATAKEYPIVMLCRVFEVARSTLYAAVAAAEKEAGG